MHANVMVCTELQENGYSLGGRKPLFADKPNNARKFMENLAATCRYYKAITEQDSSLFPTPLSSSSQVSRLFSSLELVESAVRAQQSTANKDGSKKDKKPIYHIMPALVFLNMYPTVSKLKVQLSVSRALCNFLADVGSFCCCIVCDASCSDYMTFCHWAQLLLFLLLSHLASAMTDFALFFPAG